MPLAVPGSSSTALVSTAAAATATAAPAAQMEPRLRAIMEGLKVDVATMNTIARAGGETIALYGHLGHDEPAMRTWLSQVLTLDPTARPEDSLKLAKLIIAWEACRKRHDVELEVNAKRAIENLPPQITKEDHKVARISFESKYGKKPDHQIPSEALFQKMLGDMATGWKADKLSAITNLAQEKEMGDKPAGTSMEFDSGGAARLKQQKKEFFVPMPHDEPSLRNRLQVLGAAYGMVKAQHSSNPVLQTFDMELMRDYADYLVGERCWAFCTKDQDGRPTSCPHLGMVLNYEQAVRSLFTELMEAGLDFQAALERALGDDDTRALHFTAQFSMSSHTPECRALSAPCLREKYPSLKVPTAGGDEALSALTSRPTAHSWPSSMPGRRPTS